MAQILTAGMTDDDRRAQLEMITENDVKHNLFSLTQVYCAKDLWRCSAETAEKRLRNGRMPSAQAISRQQERDNGIDRSWSKRDQ